MALQHDRSMHPTNEEFFTALTKLFDARKTSSHGSIYLTQKRLLYPAPKQARSKSSEVSASDRADSALGFDPFDPPALSSAPILIRANNGKGLDRDASTGKVTKSRKGKVKLSTIVEAANLDAFFERYATICREGMSALKKKERKKGGKKKGKTKGGGGGEE